MAKTAPCIASYADALSKILDFGHFISLDGMNSDFSFNKYKNTFFHFWLLACAQKI